MPVSPIPAGCYTVSIYLIAKSAKAALVFYEKAFGGTGIECTFASDGSVTHGEIKIGDSTVMEK